MAEATALTEPLQAWIAEHGEAAIWADFSREALKAGERLIRDRAVLDCTPGGQGFFARIQADRRHIHSVDCRIHPLPSPKPVTTYCSCEAGGGCEHAVAALLYYLGLKAPAGRTQTNPAICQWLSEIEASVATSGEQDSRGGSTRPNTQPRIEVLLYLLDADEAGRVTLQLRRARPKRSGGYGRLLPFQGVRRAPEGLLSPADRRILRLLPEAGQPIPAADLSFLLEQLATTKRAYWQDADGPAIQAAEPRAGSLIWRLQSDGGQRLAAHVDDALVTLSGQPPLWLDATTGHFGLIQLDLPEPMVAQLQEAPVIVPEEVPGIADTIKRQKLPLPVPQVPQRKRMANRLPVPTLRLARINEEAIAELHFAYGGHTVAADAGTEAICVFENGALCEYTRHPDAEAMAIQRLEAAGLHRQGALASARFAPKHAGEWRAFVAGALPELRGEGWQVSIETSFPWRLVDAEHWQAEARRADRQPGWFSFDLTIEVEGERHRVMPLLLALIRENSEAMSPKYLDAIDPDANLLVDLGDRRLVPVPAKRLVPLLKGLTELYDPALQLRDGKLLLPLGRASVLDRLARAEGKSLHWLGDADLRRLGRELDQLGEQQVITTPDGLNGELRPYQREGVAWLQRLSQLGLGGVLADDMGLGKTLQVITHLLLEKEAGRAKAPSLVVVPTSLLFNWEREVAKFAPGLRVLRLHGPQRHQAHQRLDQYDLVLTTYSLLVRDIEALHHRPWHLLVLDEAQAVKNPRAQAARAVRTLQAHQRLSLTGTPLENHLGELWAQFDFVAPGLVGNAAAFKRVYRRPIEQDGDEARLDALRERVTPFMLRRTKHAIASDLPPKTEIPLYAELVGGQRDLYEQLRLGQHARVREALAEAGHQKGQSKVLILDALLKLREACCDPRLVGQEAPATAQESAKLELLLELVDDLMQAGRRVLIFSQFTRMLAIIETALAKQGLDWVKLTGETRDREAVVNRFQSGEVPIFLVSLKAGGTGLNLTAADTVIHYDPWWNPAVTRQATDRAHRIGQDQPVFVYHLLTRDTVEERIMTLQAQKAELGERLLGDATPSGSVSALDEAVIEDLFSPMTSDVAASSAATAGHQSRPVR